MSWALPVFIQIYIACIFIVALIAYRWFYLLMSLFNIVYTLCKFLLLSVVIFHWYEVSQIDCILINVFLKNHALESKFLWRYIYFFSWSSVKYGFTIKIFINMKCRLFRFLFIPKWFLRIQSILTIGLYTYRIYVLPRNEITMERRGVISSIRNIHFGGVVEIQSSCFLTKF